MLTRSLALNLAKFDIRVNGIALGLIRTPGVGAMDDNSTANVNQITAAYRWDASASPTTSRRSRCSWPAAPPAT
jgi:NAD(P)-dependent dehydrogenase (short-subunit alcohol dehydrogenase family)